MRLADRAARLYAPLVHATAALTAIVARCRALPFTNPSSLPSPCSSAPPHARSRLLFRPCRWSRRGHCLVAASFSPAATPSSGSPKRTRSYSTRRNADAPRAARRREHRHRSRCARTGGAGRGKTHNNWSGSFGTPFADDVAQGDRSEDQGGIQYHNDDADKALGRLERGGQRGWITFSRYLSTGTARCTRAARCRVENGRAAMRRGKTGAGWPAFIWNAGIMSSRPATIDTPSAIATKASRSMTMPKERLRRPPISQPRVKWSRRCLVVQPLEHNGGGDKRSRVGDVVGFSLGLLTGPHRKSNSFY